MTLFVDVQIISEKTGAMIARGGFVPSTVRSNSYAWARDLLAAEYDCDFDDVKEIETDDGDKLAIKGEIIARLDIKW